MSKYTGHAIILLVLLALPVSGGTRKHTVFYVSPRGNDSWTGKAPSPAAEGQDGPFRTLRRARDAIRRLKVHRGGLRRPVTVFLRGGTYRPQTPLTLEPRDSGTLRCPVTYRAYRDEDPVLSAGLRVNEWREADNHQNGELWTAPAPRNLTIRQLWVNGDRAIRARHPNAGYLAIETVPDAKGQSWREGQRRFHFAKGDIPEWKDMDEGCVTAMCRWVDSHLPIEGVNREKNTLEFSKESVFKLEAGDPYYVEGVRGALDQPGEWWLDKENHKIYYIPRPGDELESTTAVVPGSMSTPLRLKGAPKGQGYIQHVQFRGIEFSHTGWWFDDERSGFTQASVGAPASVYATGARHCTFRGCRFTHLGTYAVELGPGCRHNVITGCEMADMAGGGVKIGSTQSYSNKKLQSAHNAVRNCHIHHGGQQLHSAVGVWVGKSYENEIQHNHIHDFYYSGISVGWSWGYSKSLSRDNTIRSNHVHHLGRRSDGDGPILDDMGAIYTLGVQPGTEITGNLFHDIRAHGYGGWGIYPDEGSSKMLIEDNIVYDTTHGGLHQHYGQYNLVRNNVFAYSENRQVRLSRLDDNLSFTFWGNIVFYSRGALLGPGYDNKQWSTDRVRFQKNIYWRTDGDVYFRVGGDKLSFHEWQQKGHDTRSRVVKPRFVAPKERDFRLKEDSPAFEMGFEPIEVDVPASPEWAGE